MYFGRGSLKKTRLTPKLYADGLKSIDEKLVFQTIAEQRKLIAAARLRTQSARLAPLIALCR